MVSAGVAELERFVPRGEFILQSTDAFLVELTIRALRKIERFKIENMTQPS